MKEASELGLAHKNYQLMGLLFHPPTIFDSDLSFGRFVALLTKSA